MCVVGRKSESVTFVKGAWQASFNQRYIGRYATKELAVAAYRSRKAEHILCLAEKHNNELPRKVRDRLIYETIHKRVADRQADRTGV